MAEMSGPAPEKGKNNSGIILIVVLWILVILSMLVVGISRRASLELTLTKYAVGKLKAKYLAQSGLVYAIDKISAAKAGALPGQNDLRYQCGFRLAENETPEDVFKGIKFGSGHFDIFYKFPDGTAKKTAHFGFQDEESKVNLNALNANNFGILSELIINLGYDKETAETIASSVVDWRDEDSQVFNESYGAEEDYYSRQTQRFHCKNWPFDTVEEIMLVRGMTPEIFGRIKDFITVFPKNGRLLINTDTAPEPVLRAWAQSFAGAKTNTTLEDARTLIDKICAYRKGNDGLDATADDLPAEAAPIGLNAKENVLFLMMEQQRTRVSRYLRINVKGEDEATAVSAQIQSVVDKNDLSILYWHRG